MLKYNLLFILTFLCSIICFQFISAQEERLSWLPAVESKTESFSPEIKNFLHPLNGDVRLLGCRYKGALLTEAGVINKNGLNTLTGKWECKTNIVRVKGEKNALDFSLTFKYTGGDIISAGVAVAFDFASWSPDNYVLIPSSVYNGNRNRIVNRSYATGLDIADYYWKDLPMTTVSLPQLSPNPVTLSRLEINTSYAATPAICFFDKAKKYGFILLTNQGLERDNKIIDNGLIIEESLDRKSASLVVSVPGVPDKKPEFIGFSSSPYLGINLKDGDKITLCFKMYVFKSENISSLLEKFMTVRKAVTGINLPRNLIPFSKIFQLMTHNIDNRFYHSSVADYYCPENATWISLGWIGGLMNTFPMLVTSDEFRYNRVVSTFNFVIPRAQEKTGYFYGSIDENGSVFGKDSTKDKTEIVLTRQNADILFWMVKQFKLLKAQGRPVDPIWEESIKRLADAFVYTWRRNKQWGNYINIKTGEIAVYNTTSGVMAIGGLALASLYWNNPVYLTIAKEAAEYYYREYFMKLGMTTGGCGDILQNSDSETAVAFMTSLMTIYEITNKKEWLEKSKELANLCATWVVSYDYFLPVHSTLAKLNAKLTGAVWASTQNKHSAPGFCCSSADPFFKIYRATGDERYAELLHDVVHAYAEGVQPNGQITERLTFCDADSKGDRLDGGKTGWNELNGALMAAECPGIYIRTDIDRLFVFDHVEVKVVKREKTGVTLEIKNPTPFDASVSIFAENKKQASKAYSDTAFLIWPKIQVKSGETVIQKIDKRRPFSN